MGTVSVQVEGVSEAVYKSLKDVVDLLVAIDKLRADGWQDSDFNEAFKAAVKEVGEIIPRWSDLVAEFAAGDKEAVLKAVALAAFEAAPLFIGKEA